MPVSESPTALERLAACCGIEAEFVDAKGQTRTITAATRLALLGAMGIAVEDEQTAHTALAQLETDDGSRVLRPVYVLHQSAGPWRISITMPRATQRFRWTIACEAGAELQGTSDFSLLPFGERSSVDPDVERRAWSPSGELPCGYHQLSIEGTHRSVVIVAPGQCWLPAELRGGRCLWGLTAQLYLLRSSHNWGIGDFSDLEHLLRLLLPLGVDVVGVNPLHALFPDDPEHASPYSPASRLLLNVLNIDVTQVARLTPEFDLPAFLRESSVAEQLEECRKSPAVAYSAVCRLKLGVLESLFGAWLAGPKGERWQAFERFRRNAGESFERHVTFLALREHFVASARADWHRWPPPYKDPESAEVHEFAVRHETRITYQAWLQYCADTQLAAAAHAASPMAVGLYRDLAVGASDAGAETWANQGAVMANVHVGAPPDIHNPAGQLWGLPPFNPRALQREAYRSFIELIRANMRHAGGLRIDHVMGLQHLYCVPAGSHASAGAYLSYPLADLVGILKLESQRQRCLIVGEDLGTVPEGFREQMAAANILSYRVLFFEKDARDFCPPDAYPALAVAVAGSHDLPTLRAWWAGSDLALKDRLQLYPREEDAAEARALREQDRQALIAALRKERLGDSALDANRLFEAAHAFLARTASALALVQLDDITDEENPVNVPNTSDEHPNWRRKYRMDLEALDSSERLRRLAGLFNAARL